MATYKLMSGDYNIAVNAGVGNVNITGTVIATGNVTGGNLITGSSAYVSGNIITLGSVRTNPKLFSALPSAATAGAGSKSFITDANTRSFGSQVSGGAGNSVPVYSDGTNWYVG
jgi:hypothetical protein